MACSILSGMSQYLFAMFFYHYFSLCSLQLTLLLVEFLWMLIPLCGQSAINNSSLAAEEGSTSSSHKGLAGLREATAIFVASIHSRSIEGGNAIRTRLLFRVELDLQALTYSSQATADLQAGCCPLLSCLKPHSRITLRNQEY